MKLWMKILIGLGLGVVVGHFLGPQADVLKPIGTLFLSMINMIIVPLILASTTSGICSIHDPKKLGRVGLKSMAIYLCTTLIAISLGLFFAHAMQPGSGMDLVITGAAPTVETPNLSQIFKGIVPTNIFAALVSGNILQIIVFSLILGITINLSGEKGKPLLKFMDSLAEVMYKMTGLVMKFAPIAVFAIMASVAGSFGIEVLYPLVKFLLAYYAACAIHVAVVFCGILWFLARLHPLPFFKGMRDALLMAFSTCSSSATLPITIHCASANLGASKNISSFVLPLGITFNMNGTAIYQASAALFVAQAYNIPLEFGNIITIMVTATLSSIGAAGVPGSGFIMLSAVLSSVGLPLEGLAVLFGIDRLREMVATTMNIAGDAVVAVYISKSEGELDEQKYYSTENILYQPEQA